MDLDQSMPFTHLWAEACRLKGENERLEAKVKRFHERAQETLARIVPLTGEITRLHEALEEITMHTNPQIMLRIAGKALKGDSGG